MNLSQKNAYYARFESHMRYGLVDWEPQSILESKRWKPQSNHVATKKAVRIMSELGPIESCRDSFSRLKFNQ